MSIANPNRTQFTDDHDWGDWPMAATKHSTENRSTGSVSVSQKSGVPSFQEHPVWLTEDDRRLIRIALTYLSQNYFPGEETDWILEVAQRFN